jgi:hypothetical protein
MTELRSGGEDRSRVSVFISAEGIDTPRALQLYHRLSHDNRLLVFPPESAIPRTLSAGSIIVWCTSLHTQSRKRLYERSSFQGSEAVAAVVPFSLDDFESSLRELYEEYLFPPDLQFELDGI